MNYYLTGGRFRQLTPDLGSKLIAYNRKGRNPKMETKYPNYEKLAAYLNTFDEPEQVLAALVSLLKPSGDRFCDGTEKP